MSLSAPLLDNRDRNAVTLKETDRISNQIGILNFKGGIALAFTIIAFIGGVFAIVVGHLELVKKADYFRKISTNADGSVIPGAQDLLDKSRSYRALAILLPIFGPLGMIPPVGIPMMLGESYSMKVRRLERDLKEAQKNEQEQDNNTYKPPELT